jgi:flagellar hook protein FlgE
MGSFSTPLSGLTSAQQQLQSVSNNLANIDTDGYKSQTLTFSDIFAQTGVTNGSGDPVQIGSGVAVSSTDSNFTEGNLNATNTSSNMAISGNGFFVTQGSRWNAGLHAPAISPPTTPDSCYAQRELVLGYPALNGVVNNFGDSAAVAGWQHDQPGGGQHNSWDYRQSRFRHRDWRHGSQQFALDL